MFQFEGRQTPGFNGCNLVVVETKAGIKVFRGSGTLLSVQDSDRSDERILSSFFVLKPFREKLISSGF